jgi:hypothetical protein
MFHPLRGLQFAEPLLFFSIIVVPASRAGLGGLEYGLLMVRDDTNHGIPQRPRLKQQCNSKQIRASDDAEKNDNGMFRHNPWTQL